MNSRITALSSAGHFLFLLYPLSIMFNRRNVSLGKIHSHICQSVRGNNHVTFTSHPNFKCLKRDLLIQTLKVVRERIQHLMITVLHFSVIYVRVSGDKDGCVAFAVWQSVLRCR